MNIKVTYFFRKPYQDYFSIENVFAILQRALPKTIIVQNYYLNHYSTGIWHRIKSCVEVLHHKGDLNHVTGDIHYVTYFLPKNRTLLTIHDLAPLENSVGLKRRLLKLFWYQLPIWSVAKVTVISNYTKAALMSELSIKPDKIHVIHNPLAAQLEFQPKMELSEVPVLLQVGTAYNKNLEGLIEAVKELKVALLIIGKLSENQINQLDDAQISYTNKYDLEYEEVLECYTQADILCFASFYEGFGLPILEAQATGRPVITSNCCAMPEVAGDGAVIIDPSDSKAYRNAILSIIESAEQRATLVNKGLKNTERFSASEVATQYVEVYKSMLGHG